jgi:hypothetical protein
MANEEQLILDGLALNDGTTLGMISLSMPPPAERQDWVGAADSETQLLFRKPLHENRKVTMRLVVLPQSTMDLAHDKMLLVVDKLAALSKYPDGLAMTWTPATGTRTVTFDALSGQVTDLPIDWENGWLGKSPEFTVELTCKPYWRGTETLTSTTSSSSPIVSAEIAGVTGDVPALGRLIVTDTATQSRRHVEWGLEGPLTYNNSTLLLLDSDSLVTTGFGGTGSTQAGAYDPNATGNNVIFGVARTTTTALCGTGNQSHVGTFRVKGRFYISPSTQARISWQVGDGDMTSNDWVDSPGVVGWAELDLGTITIPATVAGTQRWTGRVDVKTPSSTNNVFLDYLTLIPTSCGYGKARTPYSYQAGVLTGFDDFAGTTAGGALSGRAASAGGSWATSGDATDFTFADYPQSTDDVVTRTALSGTLGRFALLGTATPTDVDAQVDTWTSASPGTVGKMIETAAVARYVDGSNYLYATLRKMLVTSSSLSKTLDIRQVVAGTETVIASVAFPGATVLEWFTINIVAYSSGAVTARVLSRAGQVIASTVGASTALATGGALASGKTGFFDRATETVGTVIRYFDNFTVSTPAPEPIVLYSGRNMQIRYDTTFRQDATGVYVGRPKSYRGSRFLVPTGTSRVLVKARRNDVEAAADDNVTDATQIQIGWTPRGLVVPR